MILYHATPKANLDSIKRHRINPDYSQGKEACIWYHTKSRRHWAILYTSKRHGIPLDDIAILTVQVPRAKLKRRRRGLWTTHETINPIMITDAAELAASPFERTPKMFPLKFWRLGFHARFIYQDVKGFLHTLFCVWK